MLAVLTSVALTTFGLLFGGPAWAAPTPAAGPVSGGTSVSVQGFRFADISAGDAHTLALTSQGTVYSWGANGSGQLGNGTTTGSTTPVQVKNPSGTGVLTGVVAIAAGGVHSMALLEDGSVVAWGGNGAGQLGINTLTPHSLPVAVLNTAGIAPVTNVTLISAGGDSSAAVGANGDVLTWGYGFYGQLGTGNTNNRSLPGPVGDQNQGFITGAVTIATGQDHMLAALSNGQVYAWGYNGTGEMGDGTNGGQRNLPVRVKDIAGTGYLSNVKSLSVSFDHSLALLQTGEVLAWGWNGDGELGDGTTTNRNLPVSVRNVANSGALTGVTDIDAGSNHSVAVLSTGEVVAWGANTSKELGVNTTTQSPLPLKVLGTSGTGFLTGAVNVSAGESNSFALMNSGSITSWGKNSSGELGTGTVQGAGWPTLSVNFQPVSLSFGSVLGTNVTASNGTWTVTSPAAGAGQVSLVGVASVFAGTTAATPTTVSWVAGTFTYEAALANTGSSDMLPFGLASAGAVLLGAGLLLALRRQQQK